MSWYNPTSWFLEQEGVESIKMCNGRQKGPLLILLLGMLVSMVNARPATAGSVTLSWQRSPEPFVGGYCVYVGTASRIYDRTNIVLGLSNTNATVSSLTNGAVWFFAVTAVSTNGIHSDYSEEVSVDWRRPEAPGGLRIQAVTVIIEVKP